MNNTIFKDMRNQMIADVELVEKLKKRIEDEGSSQAEDGYTKPAQVIEAAATRSSHNRHRGRRANTFVAAAAAIAIVIVASGLLVSGLPGSKLPGSKLSDKDGSEGWVLNSEIRGPQEYSDIYKALRESSTGMYWLYGSNVFTDNMLNAEAADQAAPSSSQGFKASDTASGGMGSDFSGTNVQVDGIDEADIIKTDGTYIYVLRGEWFLIFGASGNETEEIARIQIVDNHANTGGRDDYSNAYDNPVEFYIHGQYASILVNHNENTVNHQGYYTDSSTTKIICLDIGDPKSPRVITEFFQSGYYNSSRMQGGVLYAISSYALYGEIEEGDPATYVPKVGINDANELMQCEDIWILPYIVTANYTVVTSIDLTTLQRTDQISILGSAQTIYMSYDNLYIASMILISEDKEPYRESAYTIEEHTDMLSTQIMRIELTDGTLSAAAQCIVEGTLLNQFSLDEYEGNLRLAVTINSYSYKILRDPAYGIEQIIYGDNSDQTNALYILDSSLNKIGSIKGLAKDERIYSVRFSGPVGYMVTFRQVDPLFAMDLSDPQNPIVTSELKIPGFSTYLHTFGEGRLLGLGYDVVDNRITGMKMSMFDVSNAFDIDEADITLVGIYSSEALYNHKAVLVDVSRNIIGFPGESYVEQRYYYLYGYDEDSGFILWDRLELSSSVTRDYYYYYTTIRGLYVGSYLYVYSENYLDVFDLSDLTLIKAIPIEIDYNGSTKRPMPLTIVD